MDSLEKSNSKNDWKRLATIIYELMEQGRTLTKNSLQQNYDYVYGKGNTKVEYVRFMMDRMEIKATIIFSDGKPETKILKWKPEFK